MRNRRFRVMTKLSVAGMIFLLLVAAGTATGFQASEGEMDYLIIDVDPDTVTGPWLNATLEGLGYTGTYTRDTTYFWNLVDYRTVWVLLGVSPNTSMISPSQGSKLESYLSSGGNLYVEGGDVFFWDPGHGGWQKINEYMGTVAQDDGTSDLGPVRGLENPLIPQLVGQSWDYEGGNDWIDHIEADPTPAYGGEAYDVLQDADQYYYTGVAYSQGTWRTFASTGQLGGYRAGTVPPETLVSWIISRLFFVEVNEGQGALSDEQMTVTKSIVRRGPIQIRLALDMPLEIELSVFDAKGSLVDRVARGYFGPGFHVFNWEKIGKLPSGVYYLRLSRGDGSLTRKVLKIN